MKVLNLYAGIGGNRKLWENVEVTAVELNPEVAAIYQEFFPEDKVIVGDAHEYLLEHFKEFDFIWASPPCPSHSKLNTFLIPNGHREIEYPDMRLYQEIIILKHWFKGKYVVENVQAYYEYLIAPRIIDRHAFWSNFFIKYFEPDNKVPIKASSESDLANIYGFDISRFKYENSRQALRNCVHPETGLHILNSVKGIIKNTSTQLSFI